MKTAKKFDCVRMKEEIQVRLCEEWKGLTSEEIRSRVKEHLATSETTVAKWWRSLESARREP